MKKNILPGWLYDALKWLCIIVAPAAATLITVLADAWHWDIPVQAICKTITAIAAFIGAVVGISAIQYKKSGADVETITNVINTLQTAVNEAQGKADPAAEGVETSTGTIDEPAEVVPAPSDEEGKG